MARITIEEHETSPEPGARRRGEPTERVLLIGASRGLGLAVAETYAARGAHVVATVRGAGHTPLHDLQGREPGRIEIERADLTEEGELRALRARLAGRTFDLLFVVAGTTNAREETPADVETATFAHVMVTNALGPLRALEILGDLVPETGTLAVMSSGQGSIANNTTGDFEIYRASKSALNQLMRSFAARHAGDPRTLLLTAPGWVRTDLGGPGAPLGVDESIPPLVDTIEAQRGHGGLQYLDRHGRPIAW